MDYLKHGKKRKIDGSELTFIRCDRFGNEIPEESLGLLSLTNPTIERIVGEVAGRVGGEPEADGSFSQGFVSW